MRLFVAIDIPEEVRLNLRLLIEELRREISGPRWVRPQGIHVTLRFLGEVGEQHLPALRRELRRLVPGSVSPLELCVEGLGVFPEKGRPRVLWVGLKEPRGDLAVLQSRVEEAVEVAALPGVRKEARPFHPHLTLARLGEGRPPAGLADALARRARGRVGGFRAASVWLFRSMLRPEGAEYHRIEEYPL